MATLTQRTQVVEDRTDRLEKVVAAFMARTDESIGRLERIIERREQDGAREREAAARVRDREESPATWRSPLTRGGRGTSAGAS